MYGCNSGWVSQTYLQIADDDRNYNNYWMMRSVCEVVADRSERGYHLSRSYSQDLNYGDSTIEAFYATNQGGFRWVFPGGENETMCVAAVAEVAVEAINLYVQETQDQSVYSDLPISHWNNRGGRRDRLRGHLWEMEGFESRGAAHAFSRFGIGEEFEFSHLQPGDLFKFSRAGRRPGHSTIFVGYVDQRGQLLERYDDSVAGVRYFSAQSPGNTNFDGEEIGAGMGFRTEFFSGECMAGGAYEGRGHCHILPVGSRYGPNSGTMLHPGSWRVIGSDYRAEIANEAYIELTGAPLPQNYLEFSASANDDAISDIEAAIEFRLSEEVDPTSIGNFGD